MNLVDLLQNRGITPRKTSMNHGGEYCSPCPGPSCMGSGVDRFHVWPDRDNGGKTPGRFWCRQCGISGDTIAFLQQIDGLTFPQACAELGIIIDQPTFNRRSRHATTPSLPSSGFEWQPKTYPEPCKIWQHKAANLLADCQERLHATTDALAWLSQRGIDADMARAYGLGYNLSSKGGDRYRPRELWGLEPKLQGGKSKRLWIPRGWIIPAHNRSGHLVQLRIRRINQDVDAFASDIKYLPIDGSSMATMVLHPQAEVLVVAESGFDAILLAGLTDGRIGAITTWNSAARPDAATDALLRRATCILGGLDYDQGGDREQQWWSNQYRQYRRLPALPGGAKDPGDAAKSGVDLYAWLVDGLPRGLQIKLGFSRKTAGKKPAPAVEPETAQPEPAAAHQDQAEVVELVLAGGRVVYITNDPDTWEQLARDGKPVFSQNELERLQVSVSELDEADRHAAILTAIEAKEIFGGYIRSGRA